MRKPVELMLESRRSGTIITDQADEVPHKLTRSFYIFILGTIAYFHRYDSPLTK
jgi:hypothetical protein